MDKKWDIPLRPLFRELNILPFDRRLEYLRNILVFEALNNVAPNYIRAMFTMSSDIHTAGRETQSKNLMIPKVRTSTAKNFFTFDRSIDRSRPSVRPSIHPSWDAHITVTADLGDYYPGGWVSYDLAF